MDIQGARSLSDLTTSFYQRVSASFSVTRQAPWQGWERLLELADLPVAAPLAVLDLACGNLRFERFLHERGFSGEAWAVDNCDSLLDQQGLDSLGLQVHCQHLDIAQTLYEAGPGGLAQALDVPAVDCSVCFGFMHHVPWPAHRVEVLQALVAHTRPGGLVGLSLWQLERSPRLRAKARPVEGGEPGDYLLGWQDQEDVARYCHSFSEAEVDALSACCPLATEVARFSADGKTGDLNRYLVLRRT